MGRRNKVVYWWDVMFFLFVVWLCGLGFVWREEFCVENLLEEYIVFRIRNCFKLFDRG